MVKIDRYRVVARFARLFPDPAVFEDQDHLVERYLVQSGLPREKAIYLYQNEDEIIPVDDSGKPAVALGTASFRFQGKNIVAEFMPNASLALEYYDFGTGLSPEDHSRMWKKQRIGEMAFQIRDFTHEAFAAGENLDTVIVDLCDLFVGFYEFRIDDSRDHGL